VRVAAALGLAVQLAGCEGAAGPVREISGERLYQQHCARCHGADGRGALEGVVLQDLSDPSYLQRVSDPYLENWIARGRPPAMPAYGEEFTAAKIKVLIAYLRKGMGSSLPAAAE
jgi:mono/diheme cytochrome c family protein